MNTPKQHIHAALIDQYAQDWKETTAPWERWEYKPRVGRFGDECWHQLTYHPAWLTEHIYRRKPRTMMCNGFEVPAPETELPKDGVTIYLPAPTHESFCHAHTWPATTVPKRWLERGLVYLTTEDAAMRGKAMIGIDPHSEGGEG